MTNPQLVTAGGKPLDADQIKTLRDWWSRLTRRRDAERELIYLQVAHTVLAETLQRERAQHLKQVEELRSWVVNLQSELATANKKARRSGPKSMATETVRPARRG